MFCHRLLNQRQIFVQIPGAGEEEQEEGNEAIDKKYLEAELIAEPIGREQLEQIAEDGREDCNIGYPAVVDLELGEEAESIET